MKLGLIPKLLEKRANSAINTWLRAPGLVATGTLMWICAAHGRVRAAPMPAVAAVATLAVVNGLYYGEQVSTWSASLRIGQHQVINYILPNAMGSIWRTK